MMSAVIVQAAADRQALDSRNARELLPEPGLHIPSACLEELRAVAGAADQGVAPEGPELCQDPQ